VTNSLYRLEQLIGNDKLSKLSNTSVLVIGVGGVGGYAVEVLARSGVGHIVVADHDIVDITNLNRQIIALNSTIGRNKVEVIEERINDINPDIKVTAHKLFVDENNLGELMDNVDYVIDACDALPTKLALIKYCTENNIPFIASMGAGNKMDPTAFKILDIRKTSYDPLAKKIRKYVLDEKIKGSIPVVCSTEEKYSENVKPIPSNAFVPATAGILCGSYIVNKIIGG